LSSFNLRRPRRALAVAAAAGAFLVAAALPAAAHVTVSSPDAAPGGFGKLVFRVPTESDTASTTKLQVTLPADTPFAFVSTKPHPGWTVTTTERALDKPVKAEGFTLTKAVATVTWTAESGQGIKPGQFDEFELSVGPFPEGADSIAMPAVQTYDDGTVVRWVEPTKPGATEPEHPAPQLQLAAASTDATTAGATEPATASSSTDSSDADTVARWLSGIAVVLAAAALLVAVVTTRGRRA
jgi:uncharacterized protein YcnI